MRLGDLCPTAEKFKQDLAHDVNHFKNRIANDRYTIGTALWELTGIGTFHGIVKDLARTNGLNRTVHLIEKAAPEMHREFLELPPPFSQVPIVYDLYTNTQSLLLHAAKTFQEAADGAKGSLISKLVYLGGYGIAGIGTSFGSSLITASGFSLSILMGSAFLLRANYQDGDFASNVHLEHLNLQLKRLEKQLNATDGKTTTAMAESNVNAQPAAAA